MSALLAPASILSVLGSPFRDAAKIGLSATSAWIVAGAEAMLGEVVKLISLVSTPSLTASWFSPSYWRIAGLAMLLTVPFLFAAAVHAIVRTDLGVLIRAAFVDLPIATLAVTITAPVIALLLSATDEMCALMTGGGVVGGSFLSQTATTLPHLGGGFLPLIVAVVILLAGMTLLVELIMRSAAIYIVVLFLPLGFAAMVWPARRVWVKRMLELLVALILSKFAMVAILSLAVAGVASLNASPTSLSTALTAMALMVLAAFSPWALLRLLPFTEIAAGVGSSLSQTARETKEQARQHANRVLGGGAAPDGSTALEPIPTGIDLLAHFARASAARITGNDTGAGRGALTPTDEPQRASDRPDSARPESVDGTAPVSSAVSADVTPAANPAAREDAVRPAVNSPATSPDSWPSTPPSSPPDRGSGALTRGTDELPALPPPKGPIEDQSPIFDHHDPEGRTLTMDPLLGGGNGALDNLEPQLDDTPADREDAS